MGRRISISNGLISAIAIAAVAAVAIRAALVVSRSDGGWEILREHFVAGLPPIFGVPANQVHPRLATANSLLREANRIAADPYSTAADLMGAALVLSDMQPNYYMSRSLPDPASAGYLMWATKLPAIDVHWREGYRNMLLRARELAREATNREPDRVDWWRLSALVEFSGANRWEEWLDFSMDQKRLETSAEHDRDNALYLYLLGYQNFRRAFEVKKPMPDANSANETTPSPPANGDTPSDFNLLETSRTRYEQGLEKPVLSSGTGSFQAAADFIAQAHGRITDKLAWLNPWLLDVNEWMLSHEIGYPFENSPLDDATDPKLVALNGWFEAHPIHKAWIDQLATGDDVNWAHDVRIKVSQDQWISKQDGEYIAADRIVERRHAKVNYWRDLASAWSLGAVTLAALAWLLVGLGVISYFIGRPWGNDLSAARRSSGLCPAAAITFGVAAVTFAVFGLVPAYRPHLENYNWYVRGTSIAIMTLALALFVAWCVRTILVGRRQDRQARSWAYHLARWLLALVSSMLFIIALYTATDARFRQFATAFAGRFPASLFGVTDGFSDGLDERVAFHGESIPSAIAEWGIHRGIYLTAALSLVIITFRNAKGRRGDNNAASNTSVGDTGTATLMPQTSSTIFPALRATGKSSMQIGVLLLLLSLACTTQWIECLQNYYQRDLARLVDPAWQWKEVDKVVQARAKRAVAAKQTGALILNDEDPTDDAK